MEEQAVMKIGTLPVEWKTRAMNLRRWAGTTAAATARETAAAGLEAALAQGEDRILDLKQASAASGYTADHLARLVRHGHIPKAAPARTQVRRPAVRSSSQAGLQRARERRWQGTCGDEGRRGQREYPSRT
jgi:hypothetical protein